MRTFLDMILDDVSPTAERRLSGDMLQEIEQESVGVISPTDYIRWVQRSLNRLYGGNLPTDGKISSRPVAKSIKDPTAP